MAMRLNPPPPRRLPGVRFEAPPQAMDQTLPRMDIALFVGFAASGPLTAAVVVESLQEFETVFGTGLPLALDASSGDVVSGCLHPAVRSFFSQGGRRCWIVRVAGAGAISSRFALPSLVTAQRSDIGAPWLLSSATLPARCPGSGADAVQVAARVTQTPLRVVALDVSRLQITSASTPALRAGDVLRLDFGALRVHARIDIAQAQALQLGGIVALRPVAGGALPSALDDTAITAAAWLATSRLAIRVRIPPQSLPQRSQVVALTFGAGAANAWMALDAAEITEALGLDGLIEATLTGTPWQLAQTDGVQAFADWCASGAERLVQALRLDLRTLTSANEPLLLADLSLSRSANNSGSPDSTSQSVFDMPTDEQVFSQDTAATGAGAAFQAVAQRDALGRLSSRFALASDAWTGECLMLPLGDMDAFDANLHALPSALSTLDRDGLSDFDWTLFAEPTLAQFSADLLADQAETLRNLGRVPTPLRGMHAAFGGWPSHFSEEPTLLVVPDAIHPGWQPIAQPASPWTELPPLPEPADPCAEDAFQDCSAAPLPRPHFVRGADPRADGSFTLYWTQVIADAQYSLQEAIDPGFGSAGVIYSGPATRLDAPARKPGTAYYRVRARLGQRLSPWSAPVRLVIGVQGFETLPWQDDQLLAIHRLMLRTAAGRGDMLALLALPRAFDTAQAVGYATTLRSTRSDRAAGATAPPVIGDNETRALSHGALHHPWLMLRRDTEAIWFPPDGAVCGQLAAGALARGTWIAMANRPLRDCVALSPPGMRPSQEQRQQLLDAQVNLLRSAPIGFVASSSDTLAIDSDWRPINVRRLMCLLRRLALQRGVSYVFEPNGAVLRRTVERGFEALLDQLYRRGALAGATAERAYQVNVGDDINTRQRRDAGQFWVELKVAPSLPLSFLTVRLSRSGERVLSQESH
jgi:hypothetical protein